MVFSCSRQIQDLLGPWRYLVLREQLRRHRVPGLHPVDCHQQVFEGWNFKGIHRHQMILSSTISDVRLDYGVFSVDQVDYIWIYWIYLDNLGWCLRFLSILSSDPSWYSWAHGQAWLVVDSGTGPSTGYLEFTLHRPVHRIPSKNVRMDSLDSLDTMGMLISNKKGL